MFQSVFEEQTEGKFLNMIQKTYEDGDLSFGLKVGLASFFVYAAFVSAQIVLKVPEIESMGSCGSILMSRFFSESI